MNATKLKTSLQLVIIAMITAASSLAFASPPTDQDRMEFLRDAIDDVNRVQTSARTCDVTFTNAVEFKKTSVLTARSSEQILNRARQIRSLEKKTQMSMEVAQELAHVSYVSGKSAQEIFDTYKKMIGWGLSSYINDASAAQLVKASVLLKLPPDELYASVQAVYRWGSLWGGITIDTAAEIAKTAAMTGKKPEEVRELVQRVYGTGYSWSRSKENSVEIAKASLMTQTPPDEVVRKVRDVFGWGTSHAFTRRSAAEIVKLHLATGRPLKSLYREMELAHELTTPHGADESDAVELLKLSYADNTLVRSWIELDHRIGARASPPTAGQ